MNRSRTSLRQLSTAIFTCLLLAAATGCGNATSDPTPQPATDAPANAAATQEQQVHTTPSCQTFEQDVVISTQSDLDRFAGDSCFKIEGNLFIQNTTDITDLSELSGLVQVSRFIGIADNAALTEVNLPSLNHVGLGFVVEGNAQLESITADRLGFVGAYLHVFANPALASVSFDCLTQVVGDVIFAGDDALADLDLAFLTKVGGRFIFEHSDGLTELCLPRLALVKSSFIVHFNAQLSVISAPLLKTVRGDLKIVRNPGLSGLHHAALTNIGGDVIVRSNTSLSTCKIRANAQLVGSVGGTVTIADNLAECAPMTPPSSDCADVCMARPGDVHDQATYLAILDPIDTNTFGDQLSAEVIFTVDGDDFTARVNADGLDDAIHPQHIHGFLSGQNATCPTSAADVNDDGFVDVVEGTPSYGPILVPLDGNLANAATDAASFPTGSSFEYVQSDSVSDIKAALGVSDLNLEAKHVVLHGVSSDRGLPDSVASIGGAPANATLPIACGQIIRIN